MKPVYKILIAVGVIVVIGVALYFLWQEFATPSVPTPIDGGGTLPEATSTTPGSSSGGGGNGVSPALVPLSDSPVFAFWESPANEIYYLTPEGYVYAAREGPDLEISRQTVDALNFIEVSPSRQLVLAAFGDPSNPSWGIFDAVDGVWRPLPRTVRFATWEGSDQTLIGITQSGSDTSLARIIRANDTFTVTELIPRFSLYDTRLHFVPPQSLFVAELPSTLHQSAVWKFDTKTLTMNLALSPVTGRTIRWLGENRIALSMENQDKFTIRDPLTMEEGEPIPFFTLPEKCTVGEGALYCFVPQNRPSRITLPDDYLSRAWYSLDSLFTFNLHTAALTQYEIPADALASGIDGAQPHATGSALYFVNRYDGVLYRLRLQEK